MQTAIHLPVFRIIIPSYSQSISLPSLISHLESKFLKIFLPVQEKIEEFNVVFNNILSRIKILHCLAPQQLLSRFFLTRYIYGTFLFIFLLLLEIHQTLDQSMKGHPFRISSNAQGVPIKKLFISLIFNIKLFLHVLIWNYKKIYKNLSSFS